MVDVAGDDPAVVDGGDGAGEFVVSGLSLSKQQVTSGEVFLKTSAEVLRPPVFIEVSRSSSSTVTEVRR